jgi:hypothetical protein
MSSCDADYRSGSQLTPVKVQLRLFVFALQFGNNRKDDFGYCQASVFSHDLSVY